MFSGPRGQHSTTARKPLRERKRTRLTWLEEKKNMRRLAMKLYWARVRQNPTVKQNVNK